MRLLPVLALAILPLGFALTSAAPLPDGDDALHDSMETLQKSQRALKKLIVDPEADVRQMREVLHGMEDAVMLALRAPTWPAPEGMEGDEAELFTIGYKRTLVALLDSTLKIEEAALKGDAEAVKAGYEELSALKKTGHGEYRDAGAEE